MATSTPGTLTSANSIYFDAPLAHFSTDDNGNMPTPPDQPATNDHDNTAPVADVSQGSAGVEKVPDYTSPGPDDELSRSYAPIDSKSPLSHLPKQNKGSDDAAATANGSHFIESALPEPAASTTSQSDVVHSPTSLSGASGGGHRRGEGSTFANGAAVTGPNSQPNVDESVYNRAAVAETGLPAKTKTKLSKRERKESKRLSKVIKSESKAEKQALATSVKELSELQAQQAQAIKREAKAHTAHTKALALHHKTESKYLQFKAEYEKNQLDMLNMEKALENERANARDITERTAEKAREVEKLRITRSTDERERQVKLVELNQGKMTSRFVMRRS